MKGIKYLAFLVSLALVISCGSHTHEGGHEHNGEEHLHEHDGDHEHDQNLTSDGAYDSALAEKLKADEFGMGTFVISFLKPGPNRSQDSVTVASLQRAHLDNITRMAEEGKLVLAGPFYDNNPFSGIYVFDVATIEEAEALTKTDPMIQEGRLIMEHRLWYGSAALRMINELHKKISKEDI